jgi:hypothetical protein
MKKSSTSIKSGSTLFLKSVIVLIGTIVLALCIFVLPNGIRATHWYGYRPILLGMYVPAIPFFIALYQGFKLLGYIDKSKAFSKASITSLQIIKYCGIAICIPYAIGLPYIFITAQKDDAPGVVLLGLIFTFAPIAVAIMAAVLQNVFSNAIEIKSENDLTV